MLLLLTVFRIKTCLKAFKERFFFLSELCYYKFWINFHFYTPDTYSVQNIGYRSTWSVIIGIGIGPEKHISVDPLLRNTVNESSVL